jgi:isopentenyl-diphosphate delta-isomerase
MVTEYVILVDEQDNDIGVMEKMQAHQEGLLHRAFSVFVFNDKKELLLQQRALSK